MALHRQGALSSLEESPLTKKVASPANVHIVRPVQEYIRVLIVDDDEAIRATVRFILETEGYSVDEAANGKVALTKLRATTQPHVVLLDLIMPQLDGASVLRHVADERSLAERHAFLLFTATPELAQELVDNRLGGLCMPLIRKPFDIDELLAAIEQAGDRLLLTIARSKAALSFSSRSGNSRRLG